MFMPKSSRGLWKFDDVLHFVWCGLESINRNTLSAPDPLDWLYIGIKKSCIKKAAAVGGNDDKYLTFLGDE